MLQSTFSFDVFSLEFSDQVVFKLDLLQALVVFGVSLRSLNTIFLLVFFELMNKLLQLKSFCFISFDLILKLLLFVFKRELDTLFLSLFFLCLDNIFIEKISLPHLLVNLLSIFINNSFVVFISFVHQLKIQLDFFFTCLVFSFYQTSFRLLSKANILLFLLITTLLFKCFDFSSNLITFSYLFIQYSLLIFTRDLCFNNLLVVVLLLSILVSDSFFHLFVSITNFRDIFFQRLVFLLHLFVLFSFFIN